MMDKSIGKKNSVHSFYISTSYIQGMENNWGIIHPISDFINLEKVAKI